MGGDEFFAKMADAWIALWLRNPYSQVLLSLQRAALASATQSWNRAEGKIFPDPWQLYRLANDFSMALGFVPVAKYDQLLRENEELREENSCLKKIVQDLKFNFLQESGEQMQEVWRTLTQRQLELNREMGKNFLDFMSKWPA